MDDSLALLEVDSIATGLAAVDALTKRATVVVRGAGVVEPGRYVIVLSGPLGDLEEAWEAANERVGPSRIDGVLLPAPDDALWAALAGGVDVDPAAESVGVVESLTLAGALEAADRSVKDASVRLAGLRLTPGLGGRGWFAVTGRQHDVEAAVEVAVAWLGPRLFRKEVIHHPTAATLNVLLAPGTLRIEEVVWSRRG